MSYSPRGFIEPMLLKNSGMITRPSAFSRRNKNSSCTCSFLLTQMPRGIWTRIKSLHCRHRKNKELKRNYNKRPYIRSWLPAHLADLAKVWFTHFPNYTPRCECRGRTDRFCQWQKKTRELIFVKIIYKLQEKQFWKMLFFRLVCFLTFA